MPPDPRARFRTWGRYGGLAAALLAWWLVDAPAEHPRVPLMAAVATLMAVWWITEAVPLAATSLIPLVMLPLGGVLTTGEVTRAYFDSTILLYFGGFLIALAMERWDLHRRIALSIIVRFGTKPDALVLGFLVATGAISMWISNTATAVMMLPIGLAVIAQLETNFGRERARPIAVGIMLAIAYAASIGGCATLIGTPTNLAFRKIYETSFPAAAPVTFGAWVVFGLPFMLLLLAATWFVLTRVCWRVDRDLTIDHDVIRRELAALGPIRREERIILTVFTTAALLWVFREDMPLGWFTIHGWSDLAPAFQRVDDGTVSVALALTLFLLPGRRDGREEPLLDGTVFRDVPWDVILLFGGGFALAAGFQSSGLARHLAEQFGAIEHLPPWAVMLVLCLALCFLTELTSNTAVANIFLPVIATWSVGHGFEPLYLMIPATLAASMGFMLPAGTPPNAIAFGSGRFTIREMARTGFLLNLTAVAVIVALGHWLLPAVLGFSRP